MVVTLPAFEKAAVEVQKLTEQPSNEDRLKLYALYKIARNSSIEEAKQPGTFDFEGRYKLNAWRALLNSGVAPLDAQKQYVQYVEELKPKYKYDATKKPKGGR